MRVLHVISDHNIGGAGILLLNLLKHFDRSRVESVVALPKDSMLCKRLQALKIPFYGLEHSCDRVSIASVKELRTLIKALSADAVHANAALAARVAGRSCRVRVVHTRHCCFPTDGKNKFMREIMGIGNRLLSDCVIATAEAAAKDLLELGIPTSKIKIIINGSDPVRTVGEAELNAVRDGWRIAPNAFCVGICARLVACKGHDTFLRAAREVLKQNDAPFAFLIAGDGPERKRLEDEARALGIDGSLRFLGFLDDTAPFYRLIDVNVNCSVGTETSCLALSEGMSAGVATVATDYGGNPKMIEDGKSGFLFPQGDSHALAEIVCRLEKDRALLHEMRRGAAECYEKCFTAERMAREVTAVYESLF